MAEVRKLLPNIIGDAWTSPRGNGMGRVIAPVSVANAGRGGETLRFDGLVDTGATYLTLPAAWRSRLGDLETIETVEFETATQERVEGDICGPVRIQVEGFRPVFGEVLFIDMEPPEGEHQALIGYLVLEAIPVAVDMLGHRLVKVPADLR